MRSFTSILLVSLCVVVFRHRKKFCTQCGSSSQSACLSSKPETMRYEQPHRPDYTFGLTAGQQYPDTEVSKKNSQHTFCLLLH